jgi:uncharacterized membrane protein
MSPTGLGLEWLDLALRWLHTVESIAWLGSSFVFLRLDRSLVCRPAARGGLQAEAWAVDGSGLYRAQRRVPGRPPAHVISFRWAAYATWFSGLALLVTLYYRQAAGHPAEPGLMRPSPSLTAAIGLGSILIFYMAYEALCRSPLSRRQGRLALIGSMLLTGAAWGYGQLFDTRGVLIHVGALIGTCMVGDVAHVIIPGQRKAAAALARGHRPERRLLRQARQRTQHIAYLAPAAVALMVSSHHPPPLQGSWSWLLVAPVLTGGFALVCALGRARVAQTRRHARPNA